MSSKRSSRRSGQQSGLEPVSGSPRPERTTSSTASRSSSRCSTRSTRGCRAASVPEERLPFLPFPGSLTGLRWHGNLRYTCQFFVTQGPSGVSMQQPDTTPPAEADDRRLASYQVRAFALTWFSYAGYYLTRKPLSVVKARLQDEMGVSTYMLGFMETGYLAAYALGQFVSGLIGDRVGARRLLGVGMIGSAACAYAF